RLRGQGVGGEELGGAHVLAVPGHAGREEAGRRLLLALHQRRVGLRERHTDAVLGPLPVGDGDQAGDRAERQDSHDPPFSAVHHIIASKWNWTVQRKVTKRKAATASANRLILSATSFRSIAHSFRMSPTTASRNPAAEIGRGVIMKNCTGSDRSVSSITSMYFPYFRRQSIVWTAMPA